ncbi:unnamed protein product [marine sediment metagenome]|uniref:Uncharacterized protein n=1 Tax=marine sediment metagenome TaxID=412755 RepID=X1KCN8_9ZZZZ
MATEHGVEEFEIANLTVGEKRRDGIVPHTNPAQRVAPSDLNFVVVDERLKTVERFVFAVVGNVEQI